MADRSILFIAPMVRALLAGRKTMTRQVLKFGSEPPIWLGDGLATNDPNFWAFRYYDKGSDCTEYLYLPNAPRFVVGDHLWVREAWRTLHANDCLAPRHLAEDPSKITFEADTERRNPLWAFGRLRPGIHMPRWASRLTLVVTQVRVERLQDISRADAIAEGLALASNHIEEFWRWPEPLHEGLWLSPVAAYAFLWDQINGSGAWAANPWVVAITFTVHHQNIDALRAQEAA